MSNDKLLIFKQVPYWDYENWSDSDFVSESKNPTKERLLKKSLELLKGVSGNETACREVFETALKFHLYEIAYEALQAFSPDSDFHLCVSISKVFEEMNLWRHIPITVVDYTKKRVLKSADCHSGMWFGDFRPEQRSKALGNLGRYYFFNNQPSEAFKLWDIANERRNVDEIIGEMCETIAKFSFKHLNIALELSDLIVTPTIQAKTLSKLSLFAE